MDDHTSTSAGGSLVVGGCGCLGYHLVRHLLREENSVLQPVHVLDRNVDNNGNRLPGVASYTQGRITDDAAVRALINRLRPRVVFHMASPVASLPAHMKSEFYDTNVVGTAILLDATAKCDAVEAFVYTSTVDIYSDPPPHLNIDETRPVWTEADVGRTTEYCRTKALGDSLVLAANNNNNSRLRTVSLRPGHVYGERHTQGLYEMLDAARGNAPLVELKFGLHSEVPLMEVASVDNVSTAHVLAAKALLGLKSTTEDCNIAGQAFNISDGAPMPFWHHAKVIWGVARGKEAVQNIWTVPVWTMATLVAAAEWGFWLCTLGRVEPPVALTRASLTYCTQSHTYSVDKARARLGFVPVVAHDEVLAESVRWELNKRGQPARG